MVTNLQEGAQMATAAIAGNGWELAAPAAPHRPTEVSQRFAAQASYSSGLNQPPLAVRLGAS